MKQNESLIDRVIRVSIGSVLLILGFYWLGGLFQILSYFLGILALVTGLLGFCALYKIFHFSTINTSTKIKTSKRNLIILIALTLGIFVIGSIASMTITRKKFLEDFNHMNGYYKQTLFLTGQLKRDEAKVQYDLLLVSYADFSRKYSIYRPFVIRNDKQFTTDLVSVQRIIESIKDSMYTGDLSETHKSLEAIRPIFQEMFKRNGFSMLSMNLVDFHDIMEQVISAADAKDSKALLAVYPQADEALKRIESEDSSNDIMTIRKNLDNLKTLAESDKQDELSAKAQELKTSFVKVYLMKG